jgi:hypothetical protein
MHVVDLIDAVRNGRTGRDAMIVVTYDENGGFGTTCLRTPTDGTGTRFAIVISFARKGFVDHTAYETIRPQLTSTGGAPLGTRTPPRRFVDNLEPGGGP